MTIGIVGARNIAGCAGASLALWTPRLEPCLDFLPGLVGLLSTVAGGGVDDRGLGCQREAWIKVFSARVMVY